MGQGGSEASSRSVAMVRAVAAVCAGKRETAGRVQRRDRLTSETQSTARPGGGCRYSGESKKHGGRASVFEQM